MQVRNTPGTSRPEVADTYRKKGYKSNKEMYEKTMDTKVDVCSVEGCRSRENLQGAHVEPPDNHLLKWMVVMCSTHNNPENKDVMTLKTSTELMPMGEDDVYDYGQVGFLQ